MRDAPSSRLPLVALGVVLLLPLVAIVLYLRFVTPAAQSLAPEDPRPALAPSAGAAPAGAFAAPGVTASPAREPAASAAAPSSLEYVRAGGSAPTAAPGPAQSPSASAQLGVDLNPVRPSKAAMASPPAEPATGRLPAEPPPRKTLRSLPGSNFTSGLTSPRLSRPDPSSKRRRLGE